MDSCKCPKKQHLNQCPLIYFDKEIYEGNPTGLFCHKTNPWAFWNGNGHETAHC